MALYVYPPYFSSSNIAYKNTSFLSSPKGDGIDLIVYLDDRSLTKNESDDELYYNYLFCDENNNGYVQCYIKDNNGNNLLSGDGVKYKAPTNIERIKKLKDNFMILHFSSEDFIQNSYFENQYLNNTIKVSINLFSKSAEPFKKEEKDLNYSNWFEKNRQHISDGSGNKNIYIISSFDIIYTDSEGQSESFVETDDIGQINNIYKISQAKFYNFSIKMNFSEKEENDFISSAQIEYYILNEDKSTIYIGKVSKTLNKNKQVDFQTFMPNIAFSFPQKFYLKLTISTNKGFNFLGGAIVEVQNEQSLETENKLIVTPIEEDALIKIERENLPEGKYYLRRASYLSSYNNWETLAEINHSFGNFIYKDITVESGSAYKYSLTNNSSLSDISNPVACLFDFQSLINNNQQLKFKYNVKISNSKRVIPESKIETIGAQYPYIRRNGVVNYKQFSLSGTISVLTEIMSKTEQIEMDSCNFTQNAELSTNNFISVEDLRINEENENFYNTFNFEHNISTYSDFVLEREYRKKVLDFLYSDTVKLFKSLPEGNMLVKLMEIQITPNETLGRMIYDFSCTAYEVADCTVENMRHYNII